MRFALVGVPGAEHEMGRSDGEIPAEHAIRGFHGVTLLVNAAAPTAAILTDVLGFREVARDGALARYRGDAPMGAHVDLREAGDFPRGRMGRGSVHHIAFRAVDDAAQAAMAQKLTADHRMHPTEQKDRNYFRSIYFREPNGILFEIATDQPGFAVDEPVSELGMSLQLPRFLEPRRAELEAKLPPLHEAA
jgi:glyoxalase family protein